MKDNKTALGSDDSKGSGINRNANPLFFYKDVYFFQRLFVFWIHPLPRFPLPVTLKLRTFSCRFLQFYYSSGAPVQVSLQKLMSGKILRFQNEVQFSSQKNWANKKYKTDNVNSRVKMFANPNPALTSVRIPHYFLPPHRDKRPMMQK